MEISAMTIGIGLVLVLAILVILLFAYLFVVRLFNEIVDLFLQLIGHLPISDNCTRAETNYYIWDKNGKCIGYDPKTDSGSPYQ